jgi:hypothetical protein
VDPSGDSTAERSGSTSRGFPGLVGVVAVATAIWAVALGGVLLLAWAGPDSFVYYSSDPAATFEESPFVGVLTYIRVLVLWAAAAASAFAGWSVAGMGGDRRTVAMLVVLAAGLAWLAVDDLLLLHDSVLPRHAGISEDVAQFAYAGAAAAVLWYFRRALRGSDWPLLAIAGAVLVPAVLIDVLAEQTETTRGIEDALTVGGFVFLAAFVVRLAASRIGEAAGQRQVTP